MTAANKILAFAASNSRNSINKALVTHAASVYKDAINSDAEITVLDLNDFVMPIYSIDIENDNGIPQAAHTFIEAIGDADALLISYAEHNGNYTAAYKNIFDWCSRVNPKVFQNKPMVIMATSPGKGGATSVLKLAKDSAVHFDADVRGSLSVPSFSQVFDIKTGEITDTEIAASLRTELSKLT